MDRSTLKLTELTDAILSQMDASGFMESTRGFYVTLFRRLCRMAKERGDNYYTIELGQAFIGRPVPCGPRKYGALSSRADCCI